MEKDMKKIIIRLDNKIRIRADSLPLKGIALFEKRLTWKNPLFLRSQAFGRPTYNIQPTLTCFWRDEKNHDLVIARGYLSELIRVLHANRFQPELIDQTRSFEEIDFDSNIISESYGLAWPYQSEALKEISKHRFGILVGPFGSGKRMIACKLAARRKTPALIIVRTKRELYLWKDLAIRYLRLPVGDIGLLGDGRREMGRKFTIAITLTLYKLLDQVESQTGFLVIDQCDKINLKVLFKASLFNSPFQLGLANGRNRSDGLTRLMEAYIGPRLYEIQPENGQAQLRPILKIKSTSFTYNFCDDWSGMITLLCQDIKRNRLIVTDILQETADPTAKALVVSERIGQLEALAAMIKDAYSDSAIITGVTSEKEREGVFRRFEMGKLRIIFLTFKVIPHLSIRKANRLFISSPVKFDDNLIQIIGKLFGTDQRPIIYDYEDDSEPLKNSLRRRVKVYRSMGAE